MTGPRPALPSSRMSKLKKSHSSLGCDEGPKGSNVVSTTKGDSGSPEEPLCLEAMASASLVSTSLSLQNCLYVSKILLVTNAIACVH